VPEPGHLARFREVLADLTLAEVNAALKRHLRTDRMTIAIVTGDADGLRQALVEGLATPVEYPTPQSDDVLAEDPEIASLPLNVSAERITIVPLEQAFAQ